MAELDKNRIIIAVDAGHGSNTAGKRTPAMPVDIDFDGDGIVEIRKGEAIKEHIANVGVCVFLTKELERCGFTVFKSAWGDEIATDDKDIDLITRQERIRLAGCQYSISVHFNAFGEGISFNLAEGVGTYYHSKDESANDSKTLATIVQKYLATGTQQKNRGVNRGSFAMVNCYNLKTKASILVELAFMTNKKEAVSMMGNAAFWKESAIEIAKGFCEYLKVSYILEEEANNQKDNTLKKSLYIVQLGAFRTLITANITRDKAIKVGFKDAYVKPQAVKNTILYAVRVGAYSDKKNAKAMLSKVQSFGFDGIIKKY